MKLLCPECKTEVTAIIIFAAEKKFDTETLEAVYNDLDFSNLECPECYHNFGDDRDLPETKREELKQLIEKGWKAT